MKNLDQKPVFIGGRLRLGWLDVRHAAFLLREDVSFATAIGHCGYIERDKATDLKFRLIPGDVHVEGAFGILLFGGQNPSAIRYSLVGKSGS